MSLPAQRMDALRDFQKRVHNPIVGALKQEVVDASRHLADMLDIASRIPVTRGKEDWKKIEDAEKFLAEKGDTS